MEETETGGIPGASRFGATSDPAGLISTVLLEGRPKIALAGARAAVGMGAVVEVDAVIGVGVMATAEEVGASCAL